MIKIEVGSNQSVLIQILFSDYTLNSQHHDTQHSNKILKHKRDELHNRQLIISKYIIRFA